MFYKCLFEVSKAQKVIMIDSSNYLGLKLHDFELLRETVELLVHIHHSYHTVHLLACCQIHFLNHSNSKK